MEQHAHFDEAVNTINMKLKIDPKNPLRFVIKSHTTNTKFVLQANDEWELATWILALKKAKNTEEILHSALQVVTKRKRIKFNLNNSFSSSPSVPSFSSDILTSSPSLSSGTPSTISYSSRSKSPRIKRFSLKYLRHSEDSQILESSTLSGTIEGDVNENLSEKVSKKGFLFVMTSSKLKTWKKKYVRFMEGKLKIFDSPVFNPTTHTFFWDLT